VLGGSVFRHSSRILPLAIAGTMREASPEVNLVYSRHEPVVGALLMALEDCGVAVESSIIDRIVETLPEGWS
jgi:hypothetical protein